MSVQELVQQMGYKFLLQQDGFSGFVKVDPESGRVYEQLPVTYDDAQLSPSLQMRKLSSGKTSISKASR